MSKLSTSPERYTFSTEKYFDRLEKDPNDQIAKDYLDIIIESKAKVDIKEQSDEFKVNNLEYDLRTSDYMLDKVRNNDSYAQNLYAALCNNDFVKNDMWPILKSETWSCSWRYAGGIIAHMQEKGDYIDWYCSGIRNDGYQDDIKYLEPDQFVSEGLVTDEIREDLLKIGWLVIIGET